jgi:peptide/nickel transport system ATP-binding protein
MAPSDESTRGDAETSAEPLLEVRDLSVSFASEAGAVSAVRSVSYRLHRGEVLGIVGESGSGKSVSSLAVMGLLPPQARVSGSVVFNGKELLACSDRELSAIRGRKISMVFQDPLSALTPVYTIGDQLAEAILVHDDVGRERARRRVIELLTLVGIPNPEQRATAFPHEFSGGMRQRVMIAMAIANNPDVIIADEPTTALDVTIQAQILEVLQTARRATGASLILITHDLGVIASVADRVAVMYAGKLVEIGAVDDVFYRPRMPYTLGLLGSLPRLDERERRPLTPIEGQPPSLVDLPPGCPFVPRCPLRIDKCVEVEPALEVLASSGVEHEAACHRSREVEERGLTSTDVFAVAPAPTATESALPRAQRATMLEARDLVKEFPLVKGALLRRRVGTVQAVSGVSFDIRASETLALVGESGCGKTTTIMEILSLVKPSAGSIVVLGRDTAQMSGTERFAIRRDLQVVFQDPLASLDPRLPIGDILAEPLETHGVSADACARRARELLELVGLRPEHVNRYPAQFSGGQRQRIGIARALALEPKLLVLDEPVSALDVSIRAGVINLLERLKVELNLSYLFVAHDLSVVRHLADRVAVMYLGRIVEIGTVDEVFHRPAHPYTQALLSAIPRPDPRTERRRKRIVLGGDPPSPADPPSGCRFRTRCQKYAHELGDEQQRRCVAEVPPLAARTGGDDHVDACHFAAVVPVL